MKPKVLFLSGIKDDGMATVLSIHGGSIRLNPYGSTNVFTLLATDLVDKASFTLDATRKVDINMRGVNLIFNEISEPDTHRIALSKVDFILRKLENRIPCINLPIHVRGSTRDQVSARLQNIDKLVVPHTVAVNPKNPAAIVEAIEKAGLRYPILFREAGNHGGKTVTMLESGDDAFQLHAYALDGRKFYLSRFHDFSDSGIYRKYRFTVVEGIPYIRHLIIGDSWMIHSRTRKQMDEHPERIKEESDLLENFETDFRPRIQPMVSRIHAELKLDYFGIDCSVNSKGEMLIFEVNPNMNMLLNNARRPNKWDKPIARIVNAVAEMLVRRAVN